VSQELTLLSLRARHPISQRLKILLRQLHEEVLASFPAPAIAIAAADQPFAIMVDFQKPAIAFFARPALSAS
jgi:hypothetical protein